MPSAGLAIAGAWALTRPTDAESAAVSANLSANLPMVVEAIFIVNFSLDVDWVKRVRRATVGVTRNRRSLRYFQARKVAVGQTRLNQVTKSPGGNYGSNVGGRRSSQQCVLRLWARNYWIEPPPGRKSEIVESNQLLTERPLIKGWHGRKSINCANRVLPRYIGHCRRKARSMTHRQIDVQVGPPLSRRKAHKNKPPARH